MPTRKNNRPEKYHLYDLFEDEIEILSKNNFKNLNPVLLDKGIFSKYNSRIKFYSKDKLDTRPLIYCYRVGATHHNITIGFIFMTREDFINNKYNVNILVNKLKKKITETVINKI